MVGVIGKTTQGHIYWKKENLITIASVFDCRQNPNKIRKI